MIMSTELQMRQLYGAAGESRAHTMKPHVVACGVIRHERLFESHTPANSPGYASSEQGNLRWLVGHFVQLTFEDVSFHHVKKNGLLWNIACYFLPAHITSAFFVCSLVLPVHRPSCVLHLVT